MINIDELEKKWLYYKIKSLLPFILVIFFLLIFIIFLSYFFTKTPENTITTLNTIPLTKEKEKEKIVRTKEVNEIPKNIEKLIISPSLHFIEKIKYSSPKNRNSTQNSIKIRKPLNTQNKIMTPKKVSIKDIEPIKEKKSILINRQNTKNDINEVIKRFNTNNNPALSLFIAKKYYELGEYRDSYNYALITNGLNNNIEGSWIIFAKSLIKLNKKEKSIKVLRRYIKYSKSNKATLLLEKIISGKFN